MAGPAAVQRGAGEVGLEAAAHDFERIIEGEPQAGAQFDGDRLFERLEAGCRGCGAYATGRRPRRVAPASGGPWSR